jgi:hypothetical protein
MSPVAAKSPQAAPCLQRRRECKGGTLIAEEVTTLDAHRARICDPDGYRPAACGHCGFGVLHVHDYRFRMLVAFMGDGRVGRNVVVARYACARRECGALWQVLPALVARHLCRASATVEGATLEDAPPADVPVRTRERWTSRLLSSALLLVRLFATETGSLLEALAKRVGLEATRHELVVAYAAETGCSPGARLAGVAAIAQRLARGIRLM